MCGITGFIQKSPDTSALDEMLARIAHRGPDGHGRWVGRHGEWTVALGHRRLSIIDVEGGRQPLANEDSSVQITFNGEVYNFRELRERLVPRHRFTTRSDTEVIVHLYEEDGAAAIPQLNGMFALGLWKQADGSLLLARDRVGIKPLYWARLPDGGLAFSSELWSLLAHPGVPRSISADGVLGYFFSDYLHPPGTILESVHKLPPGHTLRWQDGALSGPTRYWSVEDLSAVPTTETPARLAARLWDLTGEAVQRQMVSDVPVGVLLSGGLDSSLVAVHAGRASPEPLRTFSIAFEERSFDESSYARIIARQMRSIHVEETLSEKNLIDVVERALAQLDEPLADPAYLPQYLLSELAARHVKVVLGGDGGDELWAGYPTYQAHAVSPLYAALPHRIRRSAVERVIRRLPVQDRYSSLEWKLKRFALRFDDEPIRRHLRWMSATDLPNLWRALPSLDGRLPATLRDVRAPDHDALNRILKLDFTTYMSGSVLTKVDRASMAHALEVRPPLLDNDVVDWSFRTPSSLKLHRLQTKHLLKAAARGHVPDAIIDRPKKGFGIPLRTWLRGGLRPTLEGVLRESPVWDLGLLDRAVFGDWVRTHVEGSADHSKGLWALLVLDRWTRKVQPGAPG
ncbi:MAG: asparagine synthase (glutamine-hydrolyzing) [Deltaproteobacteria bacterium]|nr:asparagine synthase (glutamine-hydrolyzing) [Deltaproteobacteria bacterium]